MFEFVYKTIPELEPAATLTGDEVIEAVQGTKSVKVTVSDLFSQGLSAYEVAVQEGFTGTQAEWTASLKGSDGQSAYEAALAAGFVGTQAEFNTSLVAPSSLGGSVFITDIQPQNPTDNVGNKVMSDDGFSVLNCISTTKAVRVFVTAITGYSNYRPQITVNGVPCPVTAKPDAPLFTGSVVIVLPDSAAADSLIEAKHSDGAVWSTTVGIDTPPVVTNAHFTSVYPTGQTELKAGDKMDIRFTTDLDVVGYEIADYGCFTSSTGTLTPGATHNVAALTIANRGNTPQALSFKIRAHKASGSWSEWFDSALANPVGLVSTVVVNNLYPVVTFSPVVYGAGQQAIRHGDIANVVHTITDADSTTYSGTGITVNQPTTYATSKEVMGSAGDYSYGVNNFFVSARRFANGAVTQAATAVNITNVKPTITISLPQTRLRSGGNQGTAVQVYPITITSNQRLTEAPELNIPEGVWSTPGWVSNPAQTVWTRSIAIHDDNVKGVHSFNSLQAVGLSGLIQNNITTGETYTIGGFVFRVLTVAAFPNREASIGTKVTSVGKLRCTNLSKGASGTLNATYKVNLDNELARYTITGPTKTLNPQGTLWYNSDAANATSNTSGTMQIEIEEVV